MAEKMTRRKMLKAGCAGLSALAWPGLVRMQRSQRPDILLITSEDNGPEIGCYGDPCASTPNLDRLASGGVRFQNACITNPVCSPSRSSILTGLMPHQNGQIGLATHKYAMFEEWPNIVSIVKAAGYRTGIIGKIHVNPESAFPCDHRALRGSNFNKRDMSRFADAAERFITASDGPFFLMVNYPDAHFPLIKQYAGLPGKPLEENDVKTLPWVGADSRRLRAFTANYYNCLSRLDTGIGMLMKVLHRSDRAKNTLIVYLGDHGAQFSRGKCCLYEAGLRVPFIVSWPGRIEPGLVRNELVSAIDILPTLLHSAGLDGPDNLPGRSLMPLCRGEGVAWREFLFAEKDGCAPFWTHPKRSVRDKRFKLILNLRQDVPEPVCDAYRKGINAHFKAGTSAEELAAAPDHVQRAYATWEKAPPVELYDLKNDPYEWYNLAGRPERAEIEKRLLAALAKWRSRTRDPLADPARLKRFIAEMDRVVNEKVDYRGKEDFRWKYLDDLHPRNLKETERGFDDKAPGR